MNEQTRPGIVVAISAGLSVVPTVGGVLQTVYDEIMARREQRAQEAVGEIAEVIGAQRFIERTQSSEALETLLAQALEALVRSGYAAKRTLLARALSAAFEDDAKIGDGVLLVDALSNLEPVHIAALARIERAVDDLRSAGEDDRDQGVRTVSDAEPVPVLATLIRTGVAIPATMIFGGAVQVYDVSPFGRRVLRELRDISDEDLERLHGS